MLTTLMQTLINNIHHRGLNHGLNRSLKNGLRSRKPQTQSRQQQSLAAHGLIGGKCQSVSYKTFRQHISDSTTPLVCSKKGTTFIFNQHQKVCALIKSPYFDSRGRWQPVRYFVTDGVKLSNFSSLRCIELPLLLCQAKTQRMIQRLLKGLKQLPLLSGSKVRPASKRKTTPVWTTMRLTA